MAWRMTLPNNEIPTRELEQVKLVNKSPHIFRDGWARKVPGHRIEVKLNPNEYCFVPKYVAKHWLGDWEKTGAEWDHEIRRLSIRMGSSVDPKNSLSKIWEAIKDKKIYVEGFTDSPSVNYTAFNVDNLEPTVNSFQLDAPPPDAELQEFLVKSSPIYDSREEIMKGVAQDITKIR